MAAVPVERASSGPAGGTAISRIVLYLVLILIGLREAMAVRGAKEHALGPLIILIAKRLRRVSTRFARLMAAFREGRLRPPRSRPPRPKRGLDEASDSSGEAGSTAAAVAQKKPQKLRVPCRAGWMIRHTQAAAVFGSQLQFWLNDPEVQALIAAEPRRARRLLGPLCHGLLVPLPAALRLPKRPRKRRARNAEPGSAEALASSPRAAARPRRPSKAEIHSWRPGQKRPMPWSGRPSGSDPWLLMRPEPKPA